MTATTAQATGPAVTAAQPAPAASPMSWVPAAVWAAPAATTVMPAVTAKPKARKRAGRDKSDPEEFRKFTDRLVRAYIRKIRTTDATALADLMRLHDQIGEAITTGARALNDGNPELGLPPLSWGEIAAELGRQRNEPWSKMKAYQRWARK